LLSNELLKKNPFMSGEARCASIWCPRGMAIPLEDDKICSKLGDECDGPNTMMAVRPDGLAECICREGFTRSGHVDEHGCENTIRIPSLFDDIPKRYSSGTP